MIRTYQYYSQGFNSNVKLSFQDGFLQSAEIEEPKAIEGGQQAYFIVSEAAFLGSCRKNNIKLTEIERVVSFEMFWEKYKYKASGRIPALNAWGKLSTADQIAAYDYIPMYEAHLRGTKTAKKYASTYLNSKIYTV